MQWLETLHFNAELPGFKSLCKTTPSPQVAHSMSSSSAVPPFPVTEHQNPTLLTRHELAPGNFSWSATCLTSVFYALTLITGTRDTRLSQPSVFAHGLASWNALPIPHLAPSYPRLFPIPSRSWLSFLCASTAPSLKLKSKTDLFYHPFH